MNDDDRQSVDPEATRFIPSPGTKRGEVPSASQANLRPLTIDTHPIDLDSIGGLNPLVAAANPILSAVPRIRSQLNHPNPAALREHMLQLMSKFEQIARSRGVAPERILIGRYALCTLVDEAVSATPWGGTADWANKALLITLHQEGWGGEKFFQVLNKLAENPVEQIDLIELFYVCLTLGLEGRFRILDNGRAQLESLREKVALLIRNVRGEHERDLSPDWRGEQTKIGASRSLFAFWAAMSGAAVLLLAVFAYLVFSLNAASDEVAFGKLRAAVPQPAVPIVNPIPIPPRLSKFLEPEIKQNLVVVLDERNQSVISLVGDGLFDSGSVTLRAQYEPVLLRVVEALNAVPGSTLVVGHTDNRPSRSIRFPSNWHLSQARAEHVAQFLQRKISDASRVTFEGRGDGEAIAPNDTDLNRAKNRRVEIILKVAG